jgi:16S rRNA (cytidine1402-2'-O)-methyltransferase
MEWREAIPPGASRAVAGFPIRQWYNKHGSCHMPGTLFVVATPIGNLDDITARALRVLREVAVIAAEDTRRTARLLSHYGVGTPTISLHEHNEAAKSQAVVERLRRGDNVALVTDAGTPAVSDPGQRLVRAAIEAGIRVEAIPGPSAVMAALAASGFPADRFAFMGFPPTRSHDRSDWLTTLGRSPGTVVFFEAPHRIRETLTELRAMFGDRQIAVGRELTKLHEEWVRGPISTVLERLVGDRGEHTVVLEIGQSTDYGECSERVSDQTLASEIGEITKIDGMTRRKALNLVARRHHLPPNDVYEAVERARKLVK